MSNTKKALAQEINKRNIYKTVFESNFYISHNAKDYIQRSIAHQPFLNALNKPSSAKTVQPIRSYLKSQGAVPCVIDGRLLYRYLKLKDNQ
jgi:hypothetical protein